MATALTLPPISAVDEADHKLGSFISDLDHLRSEAERFAGESVSLDDAVFLNHAGVEIDEPPREADPALFARLLVFANETIEDAEHIAEDARKLRSALLDAYRYLLIDGRSLPTGGRVIR